VASKLISNDTAINTTFDFSYILLYAYRSQILNANISKMLKRIC